MANWIQGAVSKPGSFTAAAKRAGESVGARGRWLNAASAESIPTKDREAKDREEEREAPVKSFHGRRRGFSPPSFFLLG